MGSSTLIQRSFASGEIAPALAARADLGKYQNGLKQCVNWFIERFGSAANRAGTKYVATTKGAGTGEVRFIKSVRDNGTTYLLEFGHLYMRVFRNDAPVTVTSATAWSNATNYVVGDIVGSSGYYYCTQANINHDPATNPAYWTLLVAGLFEIPTPYAAADLRALQFVQSVDVITLTHPSYAPLELRRTSDTGWAFVAPTFSPSIAPPATVTASPGVAPATAPAAPVGLGATGGSFGLAQKYIVTGFYTAVGAEGNPSASYSTPSLIGSPGTPLTLSWTALGGGVDGYAIYKHSNPAGAGTYYLIGVSNSPTFDDIGVQPGLVSKVAPGTATGSTTFRYVVSAISTANTSESIASTPGLCSGGTPTTAHPNVVSWTAVTGAGSYNIYKETVPGSGVYGFIGTAFGVTTFNDNDILPDGTVRPPDNPALFGSAGNYPSTVAYFQQRYSFGNSTLEPEKFWMSRTGSFHDYTSSHPGQQDDAVIAQLNGEKINPIRFIMDLGNLVIFTDNGVYDVQGNADGLVTPTSINAKRENGIGCSATLRPLLVNNSALYVQSLGNTVRDLRFDLQTQGYNGNAVSLWASHLLSGHTIVAWDYAEVPDSIVWAARSDGVLLGMTYLPDQQMVAWHQHTLDGGVVEDVCVMPSGLEHAVYLLVKRTDYTGATVRYIERMMSRQVVDPIYDPWFVDAGVRYDGRNTTSATLTLTGGTLWDGSETLTLTSSTVHYFQPSDFGQYWDLIVGGQRVRVKVTSHPGVFGATSVSVQIQDGVTAGVPFRGVALTTWTRLQFGLLFGVSHLRGKTVAIVADGAVQPSQVVGGTDTLTLPDPAGCIVVGLPIVADLETLDIETPELGKTFGDRARTIQKLTVRVDATRGPTYGEDFVTMEEPPARDSDDDYDSPVALFSGLQDVQPRNSWGRGGNICIRQSQPFPARVLSVAASVTFGS